MAESYDFVVIGAGTNAYLGYSRARGRGWNDRDDLVGMRLVIHHFSVAVTLKNLVLKNIS